MIELIKKLGLVLLIIVCLAKISTFFDRGEPQIAETRVVLPLAEESRAIDTKLAASNKRLEDEAKANNSIYAPILMYHHVVKQDKFDSYTVSPEIFDSQMKWLRANGYTVISLDDFYDGLYGKKPLPNKPVVITFDDGNSDNYNNALPILKMYGYKATFFITANKIDQPDYMSWKMLQELAAANMIIGSHTMSHPDLRQLSQPGLYQELSASRKKLRELGQTIDYLAYPGGSYNGLATSIARQAGYKMALTTRHEVFHYVKQDPFRVGRIHIDDEMPSFTDWIQGINLQ